MPKFKSSLLRPDTGLDIKRYVWLRRKHNLRSKQAYFHIVDASEAAKHEAGGVYLAGFRMAVEMLAQRRSDQPRGAITDRAPV
jgi:hypothetical protein